MNARSFAKQLWSTDQYQLLDFGHGRKLERFGALTLDRPCPAAGSAKPRDASPWADADIRLDNELDASAPRATHIAPPDDWRVRFEAIQFQLRITPFGHVGLFPEHAQQWHWLGQRERNVGGPAPSLLNLFAYTGGATMHLASLGWQVTHVDAAEPTVQWARHNAAVSGLSDAPIRWLVEDARVYVARELKRGRRYDAVLLDPPSYGHGPKGKAWQIQRDLPQLFEQCCELLVPDGAIALTGHSESAPYTTDDLVAMRQAKNNRPIAAEYSRVTLADATGRELDFGWCLRAG